MSNQSLAAVIVKASSVNPIDVRLRSGYGRKLFWLLGAARMRYTSCCAPNTRRRNPPSQF